MTFEQIKPNDKVTILVQNGFGRHGQEWKEKTGRALTRCPSGWVLDTHNVATKHNFVKIVRQ